MATLQHYLSRCYIRNFITEENDTFFEYDCARKKITPKNYNKLFASYRNWSDDFEQVLGKNFENFLGPVLKKYSNASVKTNYILGPKSIEISQFSAFQIQDEADREVLSKLLYQQFLIQQLGTDTDRKAPEHILSDIFKKGVKLQYPILIENKSNTSIFPYILMDGIMFTFIAPDKNISKLGHVCFVCAISPSRLLLWGTEIDYYFFCKKYQNNNYFNLCCIEQQGKTCKIASQNKEYITFLSKAVEAFKSGENVKIRASRDGGQ